MIISGNTAYEVDENGNVIDEYEEENGCIWESIGMCRGCPYCPYHDNN